MTKSTTFPVVLVIDENYAAPCAVVMESLLQNTGDPSSFIFFIFGSDLRGGTKEKLRLLANNHGASVEVRTPSMERLEGLPLRPGFSADAYNKLYAPNELQQHERVLYLDSDILVERDVRPLFEIDLEGHAVAAVPNGPAPFISDFNKRHGFKKDSPVFNSGLLLIQPERWAAEHVAERVTQWISENQDQLIYRDQDGINFVLNKRIKPLPPQWNMEARHYHESWMGISNWWDQEAKDKKLILHYTGQCKPWKRWVHVPKQVAYYKYLTSTPFDRFGFMTQSKIFFRVEHTVAWLCMMTKVARFRTGKIRGKIKKVLKGK